MITMHALATAPMLAIEEESTHELLNGRSNHCYATITDPNDYYSASYRQEKADELRAIMAELIRRNAITGIPAVIADALIPFPPR